MPGIDYLYWASRFVLAAVFLAASVGKVRSLAAFRDTVANLGVPRLAVNPSVVAVIWLEATEGILVSLGQAKSAAVVLGVSLVLVFIGAAVYAMRTGQLILCNCFGDSREALGWATIARSGMLLLPLSIYGALSPALPANAAGIARTLSVVLALCIGGLILSRWVTGLPNVLQLRRDRLRDGVRIRRAIAQDRIAQDSEALRWT